LWLDIANSFAFSNPSDQSMSHFHSFDLPNLPCRLIVIPDRISGGFKLIQLVPRLTRQHLAQSLAEAGQPLIKTEQ
jgi:hypothetical protein